MRIYLAGPLGFSEAGRHFHDGVLVPALAAAGFALLDPWRLTDPAEPETVAALPAGPDRVAAWRALNDQVGRRNAAAIADCDIVVAVLDGADVDSGTAAEIGYAVAKGRKVVGYRGDFRRSGENEASTVNLQVEYFIRASGGEIVGTMADLIAYLRAGILDGAEARP